MLSRSTWILLAIIIGLTVAAFFATRATIIQRAPVTVMSTIEARIVQGAGSWNACYHNRVYGPRKTAARRANPDSIISSMAYDVSDGPVRVSGEIWPRYWSFSLYQQNSDNFFVINDQALDGPRFDFIITAKGLSVDDADAVVIESPTDKGIMLIRRFAASAADMPEIIENQNAMTCGAIG